MPFAEFRRRFDILAPAEHRSAGPFLDEKKVRLHPSHLTRPFFLPTAPSLTASPRINIDVLPVFDGTNYGFLLIQGVEALLEHLDLDKRSYRLGLSQIFFRAGSLAQLEDARDEKNTGTIVELQAHCRGFLARKKFKKLQVRLLSSTSGKE